MERSSTFFIFIAAMALVVVSSNILVQYPFTPLGLGEVLTWGAFTYPIAFLITDLTNRHFGPKQARIVVFAGFAIAVLLSIYFATPRIAIASGTAFLIAQLLDVSIFQKLREKRLVESAAHLIIARLSLRYSAVFRHCFCKHLFRH